MIRRLLEMVGLSADSHARRCGKKRSSSWKSVEREHLRRCPACLICRTAKELQVHHVRPFHLYPELELDPDNLLTLCGSHHLLFGHLMLWAAWNPKVREDIERFQRAIARRPLLRE